MHNTIFKFNTIFALFFLLMLPAVIMAQNDQQGRSKNKVMIEGKAYYIHIVKQNETVNTISQLYNVTPDVITGENPEALAGVHEGQVLKIPDTLTKKSAVQPVPVVIKDTSGIHIVKPGETLFSIARQYHVSVNELYQANPVLQSDTIEINQVLKIPGAKQITSATAVSTEPEGKFIMHKVERKQTLFSLARMYKVSMDEIRQANLVDGEWKGLKAGDIIRIPNKDYKESQPTNTFITISEGTQPEQVNKDTAGMVTPPAPVLTLRKVCNCDSIQAVPFSDPIRIAMILPFGIDLLDLETQLDTVQQQEGDDIVRQQEVGNTPAARKCSNWIEFYEGSLLAIEKYRKEGLSIDLAVYDAGSEPSRFNSILNEIQRFNPMVMIAAGDSGRLTQVSEYSKISGIPLILPAGQEEQLIGDNPNMVAIEPSDSVEMGYIFRWLGAYRGVNIVIVQPADSSNLVAAGYLARKINEAYHPDSGYLHMVMYSDNNTPLIQKAMKDSINNVVIVLTKTEALTGDVLRGLNLLAINHTITPIVLNEVSKFSSISVEHLHQLEVRYFIPFTPDFSSSGVKAYIREFMKVNGYYPYRVSSAGNNYGMQGYDIIGFFVPLLVKYQVHMVSCMPGDPVNLLNGTYHFLPEGFGGMENKSEVLIHYKKDYTIEKEAFPAE